MSALTPFVRNVPSPATRASESGRFSYLHQDYRPNDETYDAIVVNNRRGYFNPAIEELYDRGDPRYRLYADVELEGVSLLKIFVRAGKDRAR